MNPIQFNVYLGICTLLGFIVSNSSINLHIPVWIVAILSLILYVGDFWAFVYKLKISKARMLFEQSGGNPKKKVGSTLEPGCMMMYAFLMRMIFRTVIGMLFIFGFGGTLDGEMNNFQTGFMVALILFELFNFVYSMYFTHIFNSRTEDDYDDKSELEYWKSEAEWREKMFSKLKEPKTIRWEQISNVILFFMAIVLTHIFWGNMNREFIDSIIRAEKFGDSLSFQIIGVLISTAVLCIFFLMPLRLAFWVEALMRAETPVAKRKYRLSILFAGITVVSPTLIQILKTLLN